MLYLATETGYVVMGKRTFSACMLRRRCVALSGGCRTDLGRQMSAGAIRAW